MGRQQKLKTMEMAVGRAMERNSGEIPPNQLTGWLPVRPNRRVNAGKVKSSSPGRLRKNHGMATVHHSGEPLDTRIMTAVAVVIRHALRLRKTWAIAGIQEVGLLHGPPYSFRVCQLEEKSMFQRSIAKAVKASRGPSMASCHIGLEEKQIVSGGTVTEAGYPFGWFPVLNLGIVKSSEAVDLAGICGA